MADCDLQAENLMKLTPFLYINELKNDSKHSLMNLITKMQKFQGVFSSSFLILVTER